MKRLIVLIGLLLIIGHVLTEAYIIVWKINPNSSKIMADDFFFDKSAKPGVSVLWYMKGMADNFLYCCLCFAFAKIAYQYSRKLFLLGCVFFAYHVIDMLCFMYNYSNTRWFYLMMLGIDIVAVLFLIFTNERKKSTYKSLI